MTQDIDKTDDLAKRIDTIEETYEFMLAYAAQGRTGNEESGKDDSIREFLERANAALEGLVMAASASVEQFCADAADGYQSFLDVLDQDVKKAQAAIGLVLVQPTISSQLTDNLNASIHLRTMLTDLFLLDETLKKH